MKVHSVKKLFSYLLVLSILGTSFTLFAAPKQRSAKVFLDPSYTYNFDNQPILSGETTLVYKGQAYVPVDVLANALGYNVKIQNNKISISTPSSTKPVPPTPKPPENVTIPKAEIIAINFASNTVTIVPAGKSNDMQNQIELKVTPQTTITDGKTKKAYNITDLNTGMQVKVVHSAAMTKSIPPQTQAISITIL